MAETNLPSQKDVVDQALAERTRGGACFTPRVDIFEDDHELTVYADMPGVRAEDVDLRYENGELVLHGRFQAPQRQGNFLLREYDEGDYYRVFQISEAIDSNKIGATSKNGVLTIHLPKSESARPKQIAVRGG